MRPLMSIDMQTIVRAVTPERPQEHSPKLTSSEVANLWTQYLNDSMAVCWTTHALKHAQDQDVRGILAFALELSTSHLRSIQEFFQQDGIPIPQGFTEADILNMDAPPLFTDVFMLHYFHAMTLIGLTGYAGALSTSVRADQREYFVQCQNEAMQLYNRIVDAMLQKGIFFRTPNIHPPEQVGFVKKQGYLTGWFGKRRPLNAIEMSGIYYNMAKLVVKIVLELGFSQVVQSDDVRKYMQRGAKLCEKQFQDLSTLLSDDNLPSPHKWQAEITNATVPAFSDKIMLYHVVALISASAGFYGAGLSVAQRRDLGVKYAELIAEMGVFAEDGVNMLIEHGWMEQPPGAIDREALANQK
jgi:hypothetical protein